MKWTIPLLIVVSGCGGAVTTSDVSECRTDAVTCWDACYGRYVSDIANADAAQLDATCVRSCGSTCNACRDGRGSSLECDPVSF